MLIDIMNDHGLEQLIHFPTQEKNTLDLLLTSVPGQFQDIHSPDKLSDHDIVAGTLKVVIPPIKKPRRKVCLYHKGDYESIRKDAFEFAKEKYFKVLYTHQKIDTNLGGQVSLFAAVFIWKNWTSCDWLLLKHW